MRKLPSKALFYLTLIISAKLEHIDCSFFSVYKSPLYPFLFNCHLKGKWNRGANHSSSWHVKIQSKAKAMKVRSGSKMG